MKHGSAPHHRYRICAPVCARRRRSVCAGLWRRSRRRQPARPRRRLSARQGARGRARSTAAFSSSLEDEGALVAKPEMPWSFHRRYAATYDQAMAEIDAAVAGAQSQRRDPHRRHRPFARRQCRDRLCGAASRTCRRRRARARASAGGRSDAQLRGRRRGARQGVDRRRARATCRKLFPTWRKAFRSPRRRRRSSISACSIPTARR